MTGTAAPRQAWVRQIMGMPISVHLRGPGAADAREAAVAEAFALLEGADRLFSTYRDDSEISRIGRGELAPDRANALVREVLEFCEEARDRTGGYFDALLPDAAGERRLDPSGLVKGWAVERAAARLVELAGDDHYLNAGGDLAVRCASALSPWWRIGIEDPRDPGAVLGILPIGSGGVATSGTARRGAHIVDPHTGRPPSGLLAVTVAGPSLLWADVYATAAFARGTAALEWLATIPGYDALTVAADGSIEATDGMRRRFQAVVSRG